MLAKNVIKRRIEKMALDYLKELEIKELESVEVTGIIDVIDFYYEDNTEEFMGEIERISGNSRMFGKKD